MRTFDTRPERFVAQLKCDRCDAHADRNLDIGFNNFLQIGFDASWGSDLGDGTRVDVDLCHGCLKEMLGPWLRLSASTWNRPPDEHLSGAEPCKSR